MNLIQLDPGEKVQTLIPLGRAFEASSDMYLVLATRRGLSSVRRSTNTPICAMWACGPSI
jgi:hypothetical protein